MMKHAAIKHAEEVAKDKERNTGWFYDKESASYKKKCIKCAEEHRQLAEWLIELKQLREQTRWIPVSEKLPENTGMYLISIGDLVTSKSFDGHNFRTESAIRFIPNAWMPLPKPYEE